MVKLSVIVTLTALAVGFHSVKAANLRQNEPSRFLTTVEASDSGSTDFSLAQSDTSDSDAGERFLEDLDASVDGSSSLVDQDSSEDTSDNGSGGRFLAEDSSSGSAESIDSSEDGSGDRLLVEVESSVDGSTLVDGQSSSEDITDNSTSNTKDSDDSEDDGDDDVGSPYQPGTVKPAPTDDSGNFDTSNLSWWK
ncbi:Secreted RxLR effector peptide protein [Phytophthora cinnamomi]|uniref:Secreted RxLR effector peptide protein n=1 Tax=Phytophthora cinnamomi TaxID=4785 RepID=UPI00355A86CC|nr:Secreted RxLR effector peptide protein [Phytophthora cinnamomi]